MLLILGVFFILFFMAVVVPYLLYRVTNKEIKFKLFIMLGLICVVNHIIIERASHFISAPLVQNLFYLFTLVSEILILTCFLQKYRYYQLRINLFYVMFVLTFSYIVKMFVSVFIMGALFKSQYVVLDTIAGILSVIPAYLLLTKALTIKPGQLIIAEQVEDQVQDQEQEIERDMLSEQNKLILVSNILMLFFYLYNNFARINDLFSSFDFRYPLFIQAFVTLFILYSVNVKYKEWEVQKLLKYKEYTLCNLSNYIKEVDASYQSVRDFRHDFANILISMRETIETQEIGEVRETYNQILASNNILLERSRKEVAKLSHIKILELKSVISDKILKAEQRNIMIELEIPEMISDSCLDKVDTVRVVGILLDNAIEAAAESHNTQPTVSIAIFNKGTIRYCVIENDMNEKTLPTNKIIEAGYSTKVEHHGYGLANVDKIIGRYHKANYHIQAKNYRFRIEIEMRRQ